MNEIRSSQILTTYGPGALVDFPDSAVIVSGLDDWRYDGKLPKPVVHEERLLAKLRQVTQNPALTLRLPPALHDKEDAEHSHVVAWEFPSWFLVQRIVRSNKGYKRRKLIHKSKIEKGKFLDPDTGKKEHVVPVRFVRSCIRGHIDDIEWLPFVHQSDEPCHRQLWMEERDTSGNLDEVFVVCDCGKERSMAQAARREMKALGRCNGRRPWLGTHSKESCEEHTRLLLRGASNSYFPQLISVISLPKSVDVLETKVRNLWDDFLSDVETEADLAKVMNKPTPKSELANVPMARILETIFRIRGGGENPADKPVKEAEFDTLAATTEHTGVDDEPDGDFHARALPKADWSAPWMEPVARVVMVHRLREVVAQVGFTRFEAAAPETTGELDLNVKPAPLSREQDWLPAAENRGEGIFLQFRADAIQAWLDRPEVAARGHTLMQGFERWRQERKSMSGQEPTRPFAGLPYILLHSLSHLLITTLSLECGYPASSLRERIYAPSHDGKMAGRYGILIMTASSDAEGTLGGLVLAGREIRRVMRNALHAAFLCSNDPVCSGHDPATQEHRPLSGSACHGCLLISETSCEQRNEFLDRALLVPTIDTLGAEFFNL